MNNLIRKLTTVAALGFALQYSAQADQVSALRLQQNKIESATARSMEKSDLAWYDGTGLTVEGKAFADSLTSYSRLAVRHKATVTKDVWQNGGSAAGVTLRFVTDSPKISASWANAGTAMNHMAWSGSGGLDLYAKENGKWVFRGVGRPTTTTLNQAKLLTNKQTTGTATEYMLFLPNYSQVNQIEIGIDKGATIAAAAPREEKPIVFYGTSITQGGCASRSGMSHPGILRRWLDYPVVNLGFSGSGKCEPAMADVLAEIPATLYIIETVPNMTSEMIRERVVPFVKQLRNKQSETPILMIASPNVSTSSEGNATFKAAFDKLKAENVSGLHYLEGEGLFNGRENPTVDNSHPTDLGFYEMATAYEKIVVKLLNLSNE